MQINRWRKCEGYFIVHLRTSATEIRRVSFLRIIFVVVVVVVSSLDKSTFAPSQMLMLKFSEILILVSRKYFLVFIQFCMKRFPSYERI